MAELETQHAPSRAPAQAPAQAPADDPIARLHRMSTTAGVGTQEYVAINTLAVVAALLGVSTALSFVGAPFMVVGAAGLICGIISLRQIRSSNGTQGGRSLAWVGILLSLLFVGLALANTAREVAVQKREEQRINNIIAQLRDAIVTENYDKAYPLFAPEFQQAWPLPAFRQRFVYYKQYYLQVQDIQPNGIFRFARSGDGQIAETRVLIKVQKFSELDGRSIAFRRTSDSDDWKILQFELFDQR